MKVLNLLFILTLFLSNCAKKTKDRATVSLPFQIDELSKNPVRKNDTLVLKGYILNHSAVNNTSISFNSVMGKIV